MELAVIKTIVEGSSITYIVREKDQFKYYLDMASVCSTDAKRHKKGTSICSDRSDDQSITSGMELAVIKTIVEGSSITYIVREKDQFKYYLDMASVCSTDAKRHKKGTSICSDRSDDQSITSGRRQEFEEFSMPDQNIALTRKKGYVEKKIGDVIMVVIDDETAEFSLTDVEATFTPRKFDQIVLYCDPDDSSDEITVRKIEVPYRKQIIGEVTRVERGTSGYIDGKYLFYWDALDEDATDINENDKVTASCVECEITEVNKNEWRCLSVTRIHQPTANVRTTVRNKETMNKNGIEITENVAVEFNDLDDTKDFQMTVKNTSNDDFEVQQSRFIGRLSDSQIELISPDRRLSYLLKSGEEKEYKFTAKPKWIGPYNEHFIVSFYGEKTGKFQISRFIKVTVHDTQRLYRTIGTGVNVLANTEYTNSVILRDQSSCISGPPPLRAPNFVATRFDKWHIPAVLRDTALNSASSRSAIFDALAAVCPHLNDVLSTENYSRVFHDLLHLEECAMAHSIRIYDMKSNFTREGQYLALTVQNVAESRPSIVIGDYVRASDPWAKEEDKKLDHRGSIHEVKQNQILLKFDETFHEKYNNEDEYQITFHFSRRSLQKQHHATEFAVTRLPLSLFPDKIHEIHKQFDVELDSESGELLSENTNVPWFNPHLNIVQKQAVANILRGVARPMPYIIFGPPGTGKTITVIETILQIVKNVPNSRILVATPSNSAANLITERIVASGVLKQDQFMRLVSHNNVSRGLIPQTILSHCGTIETASDGSGEYKVEESGLQVKCNATRLKKYRILIGTCITLGTLMQLDIPDEHFSHVIIDESGQSMETESIIPMIFVDKYVGQIILAGDPQQLGPIVLSPFAKKLGLARSFLVRLLERDLYKPDSTRFEHHYDPRLVTRLVNNYRSIPSILNVYSDLFYDASLKAMISEVDSEDAKVLNSLIRILPNNKANGVVFIGVNGKNVKDADSPSWCNKEEAETIKKFFETLVKLGQKPSDIGIITPYTQQVKTIRKELIRNDASDVKVGTVEEFQGQERKVILLSTVRTVERHLANDLRHSLGFIRHPNRMNVAISRARSLLVVFGSPKLLSVDDNWKKLIKHCKESGSYVDCDDSD
ncbi:hypothetical protein HA402_015758 [Bradysia odoriphaga]|nr:hypothetical protein HA402_015758 [Bradysia odoriphaga]